MWCITPEHVVHQMGCPEVKHIPTMKYSPLHPIPSPKGPRLVPVESVADMQIHIRKPDIISGHEGPNNLQPCPSCVTNG